MGNGDRGEMQKENVGPPDWCSIRREKRPWKGVDQGRKGSRWLMRFRPRLSLVQRRGGHLLLRVVTIGVGMRVRVTGRSRGTRLRSGHAQCFVTSCGGGGFSSFGFVVAETGHYGTHLGFEVRLEGRNGVGRKCREPEVKFGRGAKLKRSQKERGLVDQSLEDETH